MAGEILDTAVEHCRRGESAQALAMFKAIREQMAPPPGILRLVDELEATGCTTSPVTRNATLRLRAGGGWDSNVSQGISARTLALGSGDSVIELELDPSYRPRSSSFATVSADYSLAIPRHGLYLQAAAGVRKNPRASAFDLTSVSVAASRDFGLGSGTMRAQLEVAEVWLGNAHYQRSQSAGVQWLKDGRRGAWLGVLSATSTHYLTQPSQDAAQWEAGIVREQRFGTAVTAFAGVSLLWDNARGTRPGGDRQGWQAQLGAVLLADGLRIKPQVVHARWNSADVFAPALIDVHRRNRFTQAGVQVEKPLSAADSLVIEWRGRWARDTVALYRYQARMLSAALERRF